ncbi:MAG TPA: ribosome small subunit-dependent GTPase A [Planctomycetaceae bacterium]|nr:ribosome small subunit-dependent GTPase A [Planctomycetaceae bacterium]HQZ64434.1 ribosome small subunit-dependent GTPase A [Planctomycetaceae bacterium]HRA86744.1 ribosome small subunit-dependent GTPase A [Planctomycetaceae bacterium]
MADKGRKYHRSQGGKKVRVDLRRNKQVRTRQQNLTNELLGDQEAAADTRHSERVSGRGDLSRRRTLVGVTSEGSQLLRVVDEEGLRRGRVTSFIGLHIMVRDDADQQEYACSVRGVLKSMARDSRNVVVTGDRVLFRQEGDARQAVIERVEPRHGLLSRGSQGREHILVANIDQVLIVGTAADPEFKPQLIDRFLVSAERLNIEPIICINKIDLVDPSTLLDHVRTYGKIGYNVILTCAVDGRGIDQLRHLLRNRQTAVSGQSGVGKSSLLNCVDTKLGLETADVGESTRKGTHTTRRARLVPLTFGGWVCDTPGIRQFELWDISLEEVDGYFIEFRPFITYCHFQDCTHIHESGCGVKEAVSQKLISETRYNSYLRLREDDIWVWKNPARGHAKQ